MQLTALSPHGRAPLSSQHSFRYLAETFSLCLPFSKACFMLGAPSAVVLQSAISYLPLSGSLSHSTPLSHSPCPHSSPELPSCLSPTPPHHPVSHTHLLFTLISKCAPSPELKTSCDMRHSPEICACQTGTWAPVYEAD